MPTTNDNITFSNHITIQYKTSINSCLYNRADLRCKKFVLCFSHLTFLSHYFNRFKTEFLGCYECFISVFCLWHIIALEFSLLLPTELILFHLFRSTMRMFYTHCFSDLILQTKWTYKRKLYEVINNRRLTVFEDWRRRLSVWVVTEGGVCVCVGTEGVVPLSEDVKTSKI